MQTTGKVILNARGVNINGYDCFVNLSKDTRDEYCDTTFEFATNEGVTVNDPVSGYPTVKGAVVNSTTKFTGATLYTSNIMYQYITFSDKSSLIDALSVYTLSIWMKRSNITTSVAYPGYLGLLGLSIPSVCQLEAKYNSSIKMISCPTASGSWQSQNINKDYMDNQWHHFAVIRNGSSLKVFIDGTLYFNQSGTWRTNNDYSNTLLLYNVYQSCYHDDLVLVSGQNLWTSNFTPPSTYLLDSEYAMDLNQVRRRNIISANVDRKLIIPDAETLKQY